MPDTSQLTELADKLTDLPADGLMARLIGRLGWPLPPMAGAEEPDDDTDPGNDTDPDLPDDDVDPEPSRGDPEPDDEFDRDRALRTIRKQREVESALRRELRTLRDQVRQFEDASKSEEERRNERLSTAERTAAAATAEAARLRVALRKGLTETQAKRLVGETEEELEKDADELLESFASSDKKDEDGDAKRRPKERLKPGSVPDADPEPDDPAALAQRVSRGGF